MHATKEAIRKLRFAKELSISAYVFGATGFGKTSSVEQVFDRKSAQWISADKPEDIVMEDLQGCDPSLYIVIDDLHCLDSECIRQEIVRMISVQGVHMVLIGRTAPPAWLSQMILLSRMLVVTEEDLRVTADELFAMCEAVNRKASPELIQLMLAQSEGNAMVLDLFIHRIGKNFKNYHELQRDIGQLFMAYLNEEVISHWSRDIQDFLMQVCVVDTFSLELAEYITGNDRCSMLLSRAVTVGNILACTDEIWRIRPVLLETLRERALKAYGRRRYNQLLYNAARYYETSGNVLQALTIYEQCGEQDCIRTLLIHEARNHPGIGSHWELLRYYQALPEQEIAQEPVLMAAVSVLYSILMNTEQSENWYGRLKEYVAQAKGDDRAEALSELTYLDVVLPHRATKDMISILKAIPTLLKNSGSVFRAVSLTNNQPSIMNGGKDFCEWSKADVLLANTIGPLVERVLGRSGIGLVQTALGESAYEKGLDSYRVLIHLSKAMNQSENNGMIEMIWADIGLQARLALCTGDVDYAYSLVTDMLRRKECENRSRLADSVKAFQCWLSLYRNETRTLLAWLESAPNETVEFCTLNRYLYMVKIYCYIALHKHAPAIALIQRMLDYADYADRTYIRMDCSLLRAVILCRSGEKWKEDFQKTLRQVADYDFVRIISEKGAAILPLLSDVKTSFSQTNPQYTEWLDRIMKETTQMARRYPNYLNGFGVNLSDFSDTALQVLRLQAAGCTTKQIAEQLHIAQRTVKYHAAENYRKLDAKNLVDAVQIAQTLHILC